jgi:hypothetical protein
MRGKVLLAWSRLAVLGLLLLPASIPTAAASAKLHVVAKWGRFEQAFKSLLIYSNAVQDASLKVRFTSPLGETIEVDGFWDGGKIWRVRFSPDLPGRWTFKTSCSDAANDGLHNQTGEFTCTSPIGLTRFHKHGQVRVARDHRHLEHADGKPFFWLADTVWAGARAATLKDWDTYAGTRAAQRFTVAQWAVAPGEDVKQQSAYSGFPDRIAVNPDFFKRLDARLEVLSQAGILSAIAPLVELHSQTNVAPALTDDQAELLVRYAVARWGAEPVAWLLAFDGESTGKNVGRWKRIGEAVFGARAHAPVVLYPGETQWVFDEFRDQPWIDVLGYQSVTDVTDDAVKWAVAGPFAGEWQKEPTRPLIVFAPCENGVASQSRKRVSTDDVRHAVYWGLLQSVAAGVSYGGQGVVDWDMSLEPKDDPTKGADLPLWRKAMFMPAAKQMSYLAKFMSTVDFWKLRPQQKVIAAQPGNESPRKFIAAAGSEPNMLSLFYVPEVRMLDVAFNALPQSPSVGWFNPRTGENNPAVAVVDGRSCQFPTPDPGDWLLVVRAGK